MTQRIHILYLINQFGTGGSERQLLNLVLHLDPKRYKVKVLSLWDIDCYSSQLQVQGIEFKTLNKKQGMDFASFKQLLQEVRSFRPQILHSWLWQANIYARIVTRFASVPVLVTANRSVNFLDSWFARLLERFTIKWSDCHIVNAHAIKRYLEDEIHAYPKRCEVIYNTLLKENLGHKTVNLEEVFLKRPKVIIIGSSKPWKNHAFFFEVCRHLLTKVPDIGIVMIGKIDTVTAQAPEFIKHPSFLYLDPNVNVLDTVSQADIGVLTSWREGLSNAIMEYMYCGLPVVTTDVGGNNELILEGETGYLVDTHDPDAAIKFAKRICYLLSHPEIKKKMGEKGARRIKKLCDPETILRRYDELYQDLMEKKNFQS